MLTYQGLEERLRKALLDPATRLKLHVLNAETLAWVEYEGRKVEVALDPMRGGLIECVVHELLHAVMRTELARWGEFEECIVLAVERELVHQINSSRRRVQWWRKAIDGKLTKEGR